MNCDNASLLLYAVTDRSWLHGQTLYAQAEQALQGGATFLQLREKELDEAHFKEEAVALKALCRQYGVPFVLDDNVALAIETNADGVHVGQSDMAAGKVRALIGPDKILGVSAQTLEEALLAEREGTTLEQSAEVKFIEDQTAFKATARYDGKPVRGEAFVIVRYDNTAATTSLTFASDAANTAQATPPAAGGD